MDIDKVLSTLTGREAQILRARYGLDDGKLKTLEEVGVLFEVRSQPQKRILSGLRGVCRVICLVIWLLKVCLEGMSLQRRGQNDCSSVSLFNLPRYNKCGALQRLLQTGPHWQWS